ncbi:MAG: DUF2029 domain-containing protein [Tatlockia sp.]|nr:DUF2029 domain-containing protein [Tatlockia sp.]
MNSKLYKFPLIGLLIIVYLTLLYLVYSYNRFTDFTPFYVSIKELMYGLNPYPIAKQISANLNPPFFLCFFYPLGLLSYRTGMIISSLVSIGLGFTGARYAFFYAFSAEFRKKYNWVLYLLYFSFFPVLMDTSIVQLGALLFFCTMIGYHFYCQKKDNLAGIFWGLIIAIKLFPALLFFLVLKQGRDRVFLVMLTTFLLACLIPLLFYGPTIYDQYFSMISVIYWYGDSWNASIFGYIFRLIMDLGQPGKSLLGIKSLYLLLFFILLACYLFALGPKEIPGNSKQINHQPFCLTLTMMVLMSPFGWLYYFSLLIFPLILTGTIVFQEKSKTLLPLMIWVGCFFLLDFPQAYMIGKQIPNFNQKIGLFSFYFYGLVLLNLIVIFRPILKGFNEINISVVKSNEKKNTALTILVFILLFGLVVPFNSFLMRISIGGHGVFDPSDLDKLLREN